ncbi:hypothetical protein RJ640_000989, partial [Escallonia rubra]
CDTWPTCGPSVKYKRFYASHIEILGNVLDEADMLLNEDFEKTIDQVLSVIPRDRMTYLFSATMTKKVRKLQRACFQNPIEAASKYSTVDALKQQYSFIPAKYKIEAASKYSTVDTLKQQYRFIPAKYKILKFIEHWVHDCYLIYILTDMFGSTLIVFTRTCDSTCLLALILRNLGFRAIPISGQMTQAKRLGALNKFKAGECNILICTDVASRGLDIPSVDMVINFDIPKNSKDYIHRVGRTARAGRSGIAISLKIKESGGKKRRKDGDDDEEEVHKYLDRKNGKSFKKSRKR